MRRRSISLIPILALTALLMAPAHADELSNVRSWQAVELGEIALEAIEKTDVVFTGRIVDELIRVSPEPERWRKTRARLEGAAEDIKKVAKARPALVKKYRKYAKAAAKKLLSVAKLEGEDTEGLAREVIALDPDNKAARKILGHVPVRDWGWVDGETAKKLKTRLPVGDEWLPKKEALKKGRSAETPFVVTSEHWRIQSNLPLKRIFELRDVLEAFHARFMDDWNGFLPMRTVEAPFQVVVFEKREEYEAALGDDPRRVAGVPGQYSPNLKRAIFYDVEAAAAGNSTMVELMLHECTHQLMHELFAARTGNFEGAAAPNFWLHEGIAEYYAMHTLKKKGELVLDPSAVKSQVRTGHLQGSPKGLLTVSEMDSIGKNDFLGKDMRLRGTRYAQSGFFVAFLWNHHRAGLRYLLRTAYTDRNEPGMIAKLVDKDLDAVSSAFKTYLKRFGI